MYVYKQELNIQGSHILKTLLNEPAFPTLYAYSRKPLSSTSPKLHAIQLEDSESWPSKFRPGAAVFFSALGTTSNQAGGVEAQRKIDVDLNLNLAKAAKDAGVKIYVLVSSSSANSGSYIPYSKMKGDLEVEVAKLGFQHLIVLRPGMIVGDRSDSRPAEFVMRSFARFAGSISPRLSDPWAQDAEVIAKAGVHAAKQALAGERKEEGAWMVSQADIIRLGRTEWVAPH